MFELARMRAAQSSSTWLCILLSLATQCAVSSANGDVLCGTIPPGLNRLRHGVDITELDLLPFDPTAPDGYRKPVIDYTCERGKKWTNPSNGIEYDMPDQIWNIESVPSGLANTRVQIHKTSSDIKHSMSVDIGAGLTSGMFSASASYSRMHNVITNSSKYIEEVMSFTSTARADFLPYMELEPSQHVQSFIDRLPERYEENSTRFAEFIRYFGTHYFSHGKYGGLIRMSMATDKSYYQERTEQQVSVQAEATFANLINVKAGSSDTRQNVDTEFTSNTETTIRYYGGQTNLLESDSLSTWQPTVAGNPWIFGGELSSISNLVSDEGKKIALNRAIEVHLGLAALRDFLQTIYGLIAKVGSSSEPQSTAAVLQSIKTDIQAAITQGHPRADDVRGIFNRVEEQAAVPDWFSHTVLLCYRWFADGAAGECGGGVGKHLCAKPGQWTQYYQDNSDSRDGGCWMSWAITVPKNGTPSWFDSVQLCYRWYGVENNYQCDQSLLAGEFCENVGSYTPNYRDGTDRRAGGCWMSWGLKVPSSSPAWLLQARICYQWYADGDAGQCGGGVDKLLCAQANTWTTYYEDNTDNRDGGCQMRWGIHV